MKLYHELAESAHVNHVKLILSIVSEIWWLNMPLANYVDRLYRDDPANEKQEPLWQFERAWEIHIVNMKFKSENNQKDEMSRINLLLMDGHGLTSKLDWWESGCILELPKVSGESATWCCRCISNTMASIGHLSMKIGLAFWFRSCYFQNNILFSFAVLFKMPN